MRIKLAIGSTIIGILLSLWGINTPFVGLYNLSNNQLSVAAKNYLQYGFLKLYFAPLYEVGKTLPEHPNYYLHHPLLIFLLTTIPLKFFGYGNWQVHSMTLLFTLGSLVFIFAIGTLIWNEEVGWWSVALAILFPMMGFMWKMEFFEQISMFIMLWISYIFLLYIKRPHKKYLIGICMLSFIGGLSDWGGGYLLLPFIFLFFTDLKKNIQKPFFVYLFGVSFAFSLFVFDVYLVKKGYGDLTQAILVRSVSNELFGLSFWWIRLAVITLLRICIYFTPLSFLFLFSYVIDLRKGKKSMPSIQTIVIVFFGIYGALNIIILPTATWGHTYFLYYCIPVFALLGGVFIHKHIHSMRVLLLFITGIILFVFGVDYGKDFEIHKQLWEYTIGGKASKKLAPYELLGINNYPGMLMENYYSHPTQDIPFGDIPLWIRNKKDNNIQHLLLPCTGNCSIGEMEMATLAKKHGNAFLLTVDNHKAWLLQKWNISEMTMPEKKEKTLPVFPQTNSTQKQNSILWLYRIIRDSISAEQI